MPSSLICLHNPRITFPRLHGGLQFFDRHLGRHSVIRIACLQDTLKIRITARVRTADDEAAVLSDDMRIDQGIIDIQGQGSADIFHRKTRHQSRAL